MRLTPRPWVEVDTVHLINRPLLSQVALTTIELDLFKIHATVVFFSFGRIKGLSQTSLSLEHLLGVLLLGAQWPLPKPSNQSGMTFHFIV